MNAKARIKQLEKTQGTDKKIKYLCTSKAGDTEYKASPFAGVEGETFTFKTEEAMTEFFNKHTEFELLHIQVVYASEAIKDGNE